MRYKLKFPPLMKLLFFYHYHTGIWHCVCSMLFLENASVRCYIYDKSCLIYLAEKKDETKRHGVVPRTVRKLLEFNI
ncbi:unnamed protein product [Amaranthus hypochondriacus]